MTCIYRGCDADADLICRPHELALQLMGFGVPDDEAHRLAALDGKPMNTVSTELVEEDDEPVGVETTATTGDVIVIVPALIAPAYRRSNR